MAGRPPGSSANGKQRLLDACWDLLVELPVGERLTISAVCDKAGCTPPTLYHHFGDLAALERAASRRAHAAWSDDVEAACSSETAPEERLERRGKAYLQWANENVDAYHALFSQPRKCQDPHAGDILAPAFQGLLKDLGEIHNLRTSDEALLPLAFAYWSGVHGLATLSITVPFFPKDAQDSALALILESFTSRTSMSASSDSLRVAS